MLTEMDVGGIYVASFAVHLALAVPVFLILRWVLIRCDVLTGMWSIALCEVSLFVIVLFLCFPLVVS